jgi:hypothetical protein
VSVDITRFRRAGAFDGDQHRAQDTAKFELLAQAVGVVRQQRKLLQAFLQLSRGFRQCRARGGSVSSPGPEAD